MYRFKHRNQDEVRVDFDGQKFDVSVQFPNWNVDSFTFTVDSEITAPSPYTMSQILIMEEIKRQHTEGII